MYGYDDSHMNGGGVIMVVLMVLLTITVLAAVGLSVWALVRLGRVNNATGPRRRAAEATLDDRFARGELDASEYRTRLSTLRSSHED